MSSRPAICFPVARDVRACIAFPALLTALLASSTFARTPLSAPDKGAVGPGSGPCVAALGCQVVRAGFFDCDNSSITQALSRSPLVEIRVVAGSTAENVAIADRSLALVGGYASCQSARDGVPGAPGSVTVVDAGGSATPTINITASTAAPRSVVLSRVHITGTDGAAQGALRVVGLAGQGRASPLLVTLHESRVFANVATLGGGAYVRDAGLVLDDSRIEQNQALQSGGGVYCVQGALRLGTPASRIGNNTALTHGGGVYADDCFVTSLGGGGFDTIGAARGGLIGNSTSLGSGGGLHARGGTYFEAGPNQNPGGRMAMIEDNVANAFDGAGTLGGGGIFLTGSGTRANITNVRLQGNRAGSNTPAAAAPDSVGGAIAVVTDALLEVVRVGTPLQCVDTSLGLYRGMCSEFAMNVATGSGGAIYAQNAAVDIEGAFIGLNRSRGASVAFAGSHTKRLQTSLLLNNFRFSAERPLQHVVAVTSGDAVLRFLTLSANREHTVATIGQGIANVQLRAVLIDEERDPAPPALAYDSSAPPTVACLQAHETASLPPGALRSYGPAPQNWTAAQVAVSDFHLHAASGDVSSGVDACAIAEADGGLGLGLDIDGEPRAHDVASVGDLGGGPAPVDVGFDEFVPASVFADGFEAP